MARLCLQEAAEGEPSWFLPPYCRWPVTPGILGCSCTSPFVLLSTCFTLLSLSVFVSALQSPPLRGNINHTGLGAIPMMPSQPDLTSKTPFPRKVTALVTFVLLSESWSTLWRIYFISELREKRAVRVGAQGRNLEAGIWTGSMKGYCFQAFLPWLAQLPFLFSPGPSV